MGDDPTVGVGKGHRGESLGPLGGGAKGGPGLSGRWEGPSLAGIFPSSTKVCWKSVSFEL